MLSRAYVRFREGLPDGPNAAAAADGFSRIGAEVVPFDGFGDVATLPGLGAGACVVGYVCDVNSAMDALGLPRPELSDYPQELRPFLGRHVWSHLVLGDVRSCPRKHVFVKPHAQKLFTGLVWDGSRSARLRLAAYPDETPVHVSDVVEFVSEYRAFVLGRELLDVRRYRGDWSVAPDRRVVEAAVAECPERPAAFALDWGITSDGRTLLVERNDATALGHYGLASVPYARMIEARWAELVQATGSAVLR